MRTFSAPFTAAMLAADTEEIVVFLVTIEHPDLGTQVLRLSSDNRDLLDVDLQLRGTRSRGLTFGFLPMSLSLPEEGEDASEVINIIIDGVTREATPILRSTTKPAAVTVELVTAAAPDTVLSEWPFFELTGADVDASRVTLALSIDAMASEPYPADNFTPATFGGLWSTT